MVSARTKEYMVPARTKEYMVPARTKEYMDAHDGRELGLYLVIFSGSGSPITLL